MYKINIYEKSVEGFELLSSDDIKSEKEMYDFKYRIYQFNNPMIVEIISNANENYAQIAKIKIVHNQAMYWNAIKSYFDRRAMAFGYSDVFNDDED